MSEEKMTDIYDLPKNHAFRDFLRRFSRNRLAVVGAVILLLIILAAVFADKLAPYGYDEQALLDARQKPSAAHWFGTDNLGRDIFSRVLYGARTSLVVGLISVGVGLLTGGILGTLAAYFGGIVDNVIMRLIDILMSVPSVILSIAICAALGQGMVNTMIAVGIGTVPTYARVMRAAVLQVKQTEYIEAARSLGMKDLRIIRSHVIVNAMSPMIVQASVGIASAITTAASLSFIGLGIQPPTPEWGAMISTGRSFFRDYPHMVVFPGLAIMLTVLSLNLIGDGLRDALDPRMKR